jgi:predicted alpha/beta hydrolase family esterase
MTCAQTRRHPGVQQILFVQGGGAGAHDEWDDKLVASLERGLGDTWEVRYPRMPGEDDPSCAAWSAAIRREVAHLDDGAVVVGHSLGGTLLLQALTGAPQPRNLAGIVLLSAPFVGAGGWAREEFELPSDLGARLSLSVWVHVFHGLDDQTVPSSHARLYAHAIPQAQLHLRPGRDHQLNDDLGDVVRVLEASR